MLLSVGRWYFTILVIPPKAFIFKERLSERFASSDYNVLKNKPAPASVISSPAPQRISLCASPWKRQMGPRDLNHRLSSPSVLPILTWGQQCRLSITLEIKIPPPQKGDMLAFGFAGALRRTMDLWRSKNEIELGELGTRTARLRKSGRWGVVSSHDWERVSSCEICRKIRSCRL